MVARIGATGQAPLQANAVDPFARRRSPHPMIGWSRLLAGRLHDPLVGCEHLVGAAVAVGMSLTLSASVALPREWTGSNDLPNWQAMSAVGSLPVSACYLLANTHLALLLALGSLFAYQLRFARRQADVRCVDRMGRCTRERVHRMLVASTQ